MSGHDSSRGRQTADAGRCAISVAVCTYNGEAYLREQLESIARQSRPPDEVVLVDDLSEDATHTIAMEFADRAAFPVRVEVNPQRLGVTKNFEKAIAACSGDMIVLADQDDVWHADKLALFARILAERPDVALVFSDAELVDAELNPLGYSFWDSLAFDASERRMMQEGEALTVLLRRNVVAGATMAFRADFCPLVLPIDDQWPHDAWIVSLLAAVAGIALTERKLIRYRQHDRNVCGARKPEDSLAGHIAASRAIGAQEYMDKAERYRRLELRLQADDDGHTARSRQNIRACITHLQMRAQMAGGKVSWAVRFVRIVSELVNGNYFRYSDGLRSAIKDMVGYRVFG